MYERNAIVLERYFYDLFKYKETSNIKENYGNYCELIGNLEKYNIATENETTATFDFDNASANIKKIQKLGEKLYNKSAKLEYSRYIVYENIEEKSEEIAKCLEKIESDVEKNNEALEKLDEEFKISSDNYKEKKATLARCQRENREAKIAYEKSLRKTKQIINGILDQDISIARDFLVSENKDRKKDLNNILNENGKNEKNPFDLDVISTAVNASFNIYTKEIDLLLNAYERTQRLLTEIEGNDVKMDKHKKLIRDTNVKLHFLAAQKEYIVGFLDNERITAIYDKKIHRKLMLESCRNLESDTEYINSMYDIILKEAASRASKRLYKDNYNINYLDEIEKVAEGANEETNKLKANAVAVMNLNYWRIDGIHRIQDVFEADMINVYERDISEIFPERQENQEGTEEKEQSQAFDTKSKTKKKIKYTKLKSSKSALKEAVLNENKVDNEAETYETSQENENQKSIADEFELNLTESEIETEEDKTDVNVVENEVKKAENNEDKKYSIEQSKIEEDIKKLEDQINSIEDINDDEKEETEIEDDDYKEYNSDENDTDTDVDESDEESQSLFDKISKLDELENDTFKYNPVIEKNDIKNMMMSKISKTPESEPTYYGKEISLEERIDEISDEGINDSVIDFYFSNADNAERKRKSHDEKKLNKESKRRNFSKINGF